MATAAQLSEGVPSMSEPCPTEPEPGPCGLPAPGPSRGVTLPPETSPLQVSSLPDIPLLGTPLVGHPFVDFLPIPSKGNWDHYPSDSPNHLHAKRAHITSPEVKVGSEHSFTQGSNHTPNLTPETGTGSR